MNSKIMGGKQTRASQNDENLNVIDKNNYNDNDNIL